MANSEQNEPIEEGSLDGSAEQKKQGILAQVAADTGGKTQAEILQVLTQRVEQAGVQLQDGELAELAKSLPNLEWERAAPIMTSPKTTDSGSQSSAGRD